MTVGATHNETKDGSKALYHYDYCMCGCMDSSDYDYYFWNKKCQETVSANAAGIGCLS